MTRAALYRMLDDIPEPELGRIADLVAAARSDDRAAVQLILAPHDEPSKDEIAALDANVDLEPTSSLDDVLAHFGLAPSH